MEKDDSFWLNIGYVSFFAICAYVGWQALQTLGIETGWIERYDQWYEPVAYLVAGLIGTVAYWVVRRDPERHEYLLASIGELRKVSWPSANDTRRMTIIVCVVVGFFAVVLLVFDMSWSYLLKGIIAYFA